MQRVKGLDGVRGLAILWVLLYHLYALMPKAPWAASLPGIGVLAEFGWIGVNLFFGLSGFLIIPLLAEQKGTPHFFARFWCRRAFRLLPVYLLFMVSYYVAAACWPAASVDRERLLGAGVPLWTYWAMVQNVWMSALGYMGNEWLRVSWSLAVEVQFYALIGVLVHLVPRRQLAAWLAGLAVAVVGFRFAVVGLNPTATAPLVLLLPSRLDAFVIGGLVALLPPATGRGGWGRDGLALALLGGAVAAFAWFVSGGFGASTRLMLPTYYLMLALGSAALLDLAARSSPLVRWLVESAPMIRAGQLSYFVYLFHLPVTWTVFVVATRHAPGLETGTAAAVMALAVAVLLALAEASYRWIESPLIRRSHGYFAKPKSPSVIPADPAR